jgi:hypothetical protein
MLVLVVRDTFISFPAVIICAQLNSAIKNPKMYRNPVFILLPVLPLFEHFFFLIRCNFISHTSILRNLIERASEQTVWRMEVDVDIGDLGIKTLYRYNFSDLKNDGNCKFYKQSGKTENGENIRWLC